jgi:hypothetical protein
MLRVRRGVLGKTYPNCTIVQALGQSEPAPCTGVPMLRQGACERRRRNRSPAENGARPFAARASRWHVTWRLMKRHAERRSRRQTGLNLSTRMRQHLMRPTLPPQQPASRVASCRLRRGERRVLQSEALMLVQSGAGARFTLTANTSSGLVFTSGLNSSERRAPHCQWTPLATPTNTPMSVYSGGPEQSFQLDPSGHSCEQEGIWGCRHKPG